MFVQAMAIDPGADRRHSLIRLLRGNNAQVFPGENAGAVTVVPGRLQGIIAYRNQSRDAIGAPWYEREQIRRRMFHAHIGMSAATFDAGAGFAQVAQRIQADQAVHPCDFQLLFCIVHSNCLRSDVHSASPGICNRLSIV